MLLDVGGFIETADAVLSVVQIFFKGNAGQLLLSLVLKITAHAIMNVVEKLQSPIHSLAAIPICHFFDVHAQKNSPDGERRGFLAIHVQRTRIIPKNQRRSSAPIQPRVCCTLALFHTGAARNR